MRDLMRVFCDGFKQPFLAMRRAWCKHESSLDDLRRVSPDMVIVVCLKCGKELTAPYGIVLDTKWVSTAAQLPNRSSNDRS